MKKLFIVLTLLASVSSFAAPTEDVTCNIKVEKFDSYDEKVVDQNTTPDFTVNLSDNDEPTIYKGFLVLPKSKKMFYPRYYITRDAESGKLSIVTQVSGENMTRLSLETSVLIDNQTLVAKNYQEAYGTEYVEAYNSEYIATIYTLSCTISVK